MEEPSKLSQVQIEEIVDSSNMNFSKEQREKMISNLQNKKKSPNTLIMNGDIEALQALIDDGLNVNEIGFSGAAPLLAVAIMYSDIDIVKLLIKNGADVNIMIQDKPLLVYASSFGDIGIIKLLIENGANVNVLDNENPIILQALIYGNNELVKLLIEYGANIEFENNSSLLDQSLLFANTEIAELCIKKGSNFSPNILFDVAKGKDGYIFDRKLIIDNILDKKKKLLFEFAGTLDVISGMIQDKEENIAFLNSIKIVYQINKCKILDKNSEIDDLEKELEKIKSNFSNESLNKNWLIELEKKISNEELSLKEIDERIDKLKAGNNSHKLNNLHNRLNKMRRNMTNLINKMNDMQDKMTVSTIIDFIKIFIKYGGDINYKDENGSTALMLLSYFGYEDCVKFLIENDAEIDTQNSGIETPLLLAYENNHFNIVKLLIDSGADVNITMDNGESFYKKAKQDQKQEVLEWIENSPTFIKITHDPKALVNILKSFRKDNPLKFTTHSWDGDFNKNFKENYGDFDGFLEDIKKEWDSVSSDLRQLPPNLYKKIYSFLLAKEPSCSWYSKNSKNSEKICIGWSSLRGLKEWCDEGNDPFKYKLPKPYKIEGKTITIFGQIIELFKHEVQFRNQHQVLDKEDMLEELFWNLEEELLGESFEVEYINLDKKEFYTDVEKFTEAINLIFIEIKKQSNQSTKVIVELLEDKVIPCYDIKITHIGSKSGHSTEDMSNKINGGDSSKIKDALNSLCEWSIESSHKGENYRINCLYSNNIDEKEPLPYQPEGFTYILRFYK